MNSAITVPLFALRRGRTSGLESAIFNLLRGFAEVGTDLRVAAGSRATLPEAVAAWLEERAIPVARYPGFGPSMPARFVEEVVFGLTSDARQVIFPNYFLPPRGPRMGRRFVIIHDLQHRVFPANFSARKVRWLDRQFERTLRTADKVVFISQAEREQARRFFGPLEEERMAVVPNAIDWSRFERGTPSAVAAAAAERPFLLSVAQHYPHKRQEFLLRAFAEVAARDRDCRLVMVGRATGALVELARAELGEALFDRVLFLGFVSDADLAFLYSQAALFVLPSLYEGFGMPAAEALGLGCPALVTGSTALPEVTVNRAHYLPPEADAATWAERIEHLLRAPEPVSQAVSDEVRARFQPSRIARQFEDLFAA